MTDVSYTGAAEKYQKARPDYPAAMMAALRDFAAGALSGERVTVLDVGCGTGISTRALRRALPGHVALIGVEPNADMRGQAAEAGRNDPAMRFVEGKAERLSVEDASCALVVAGQAAQYFDRPAFYAEAARVLVPGGALALFENNRDWRASAFLARHEDFLETHSVRPDGSLYSRFYRDHPYAQELLRQFGNSTALQFPWVRTMSVAAFMTMAESSTQAMRALVKLGRERGLAEIRNYVEAAADGEGNVAVPFVAELYLARKVPAGD